MRLIIALIVGVMLMMFVFSFADGVNSDLLKSTTNYGQKTASVSSSEGENSAADFLNRTQKMFQFMLGKDKPEEKSDLQKLLDQRRRDTRPIDFKNSVEVY